ncbi:aldehyde dehydrogenase family protein [Mycobacterium palustre]|uniref:Putative succinate-semialdehyde dehydrogenase [NADP(+)] 2 n=1 Tax=Mycobacterium palustre TaxID=153971 RepID=A0A1X1ZJZ9_9MYCO|nr:aldehyde dehydrogenase family protein [Mycobacterium palustre]ORW23605.1 aldehyde dehydrogenase [Mycobacterium palustre]
MARRLRVAQPAWAAMGFQARRVWLERFRDWILDNEDRLLRLVQDETGKTWGDLPIGEIVASVDVLNYWARNAEKFLAPEKARPHNVMMATKRMRVTYQPHQLVGSITPWNAQLAMQMLDIPAALMAGCAVLTKASEVTPLAWAAAVDGWKEIGAPDVLDAVTGRGEAGAAVVDAVDMIQFTGSVGTGRRIGVRAAERMIPCCLELGGKDAMIVLADADIDRAAKAAVWGGFYNAGQICVSIERVYVEAPVYDEFVAKVVELTRKLRVGTDAPNSYDADIGAVATPDQLSIIERHVADAVAGGATVATGGRRVPGPGLFHQPTVLLGVDESMACMREETFGPTLPIVKVADADEAVRRANDSEFGLAASVFTRDHAKGRAIAERVDSGSVNVNNVMTNVFQLPVPFGGRRSSGLGARHGGAEGIRKYCWQKSIIEERFNLPSEIYWYPTKARNIRLMTRAARLLSAGDWKRRLHRR